MTALAIPSPENEPVITPELVRRRLKERGISPSGIDRFRRCPRRFRYQDVERIRRPFQPSPALAQGSAVHEALDLFYGLPAGERSTENLHQALRAAWVHHRAGVFSGRDEERRCGLEALEMLSSFAANADLSAIPLARERWLSITPPELGGIRVFGKVDRIDSLPSGGLELVDYKCGRTELEARDLPDEPACQVYAAGAQAIFRRPVEVVRLTYLRTGERAVWTPEPDEVESARKRLVKVVEEILETEDFQPAPGGHCQFCPFTDLCPGSGDTRREDLSVPEHFPF